MKFSDESVKFALWLTFIKLSISDLLIEKFKELNIPFIIVINKTDIQRVNDYILTNIYEYTKNVFITSAKTDNQIVFKFKETLLKILPDDFINTPKIVGDLVKEKSVVILVIPIDKEAPKGRIILPQVQTLRDLLDSNCLTLVVKDTELEQALNSLKEPPALVVTDSQAFKKVSEIVPQNIPLTSFSILFARLKGDLPAFVLPKIPICNLIDFSVFIR